MMNVSLLCKWWWMLKTGSGLWQDIVNLKYVKQFPTCDIPNRMQDSPLWKDLMKVRFIYLMGREYKLKNGKRVSFWKDAWLDNNPLCVSYPILFDICVNHNCLVWEVAQNGWVVNFKVRLHGILREQWYTLAATLNGVRLSNEPDVVVWKWASKKSFMVKSVYNHLSRGDAGPSFSKVWRSRLSEKIKIFMWLLEQKAILTKDNMLKRKWQRDPGCYFCGNHEDCDHLMFTCPVSRVIWGVITTCFKQKHRPSAYEQFWLWIKGALPGGDSVHMLGLAPICWAIWKTRNVVCFEKRIGKNPLEILYYACVD
jgi:hypothetical protein